jgi:hypothetical protein
MPRSACLFFLFKDATNVSLLSLTERPLAGKDGMRDRNTVMGRAGRQAGWACLTSSCFRLRSCFFFLPPLTELMFMLQLECDLVMRPTTTIDGTS